MLNLYSNPFRSQKFVNWHHSGNLVEIGSYYKTPPDMDDGFGYSLPRGDRGSTIRGAIPEGTVIGPVVRFLTAQIVGTRD